MVKASDREIYEKCKMDCFHCPFPDCMLSTNVIDGPSRNIGWTEEMDNRIMNGKRNGETFASIAKELQLLSATVRYRYLKLEKTYGKEQINERVAV